jgi:hypothetical protein
MTEQAYGELTLEELGAHQAWMATHPAWGDTQELLAGTVEQLQVIGSLLHHAWFKPPHPEPVRVPRPGAIGGSAITGPAEPEPEPVKMSSREEIRAFFKGEGTTVAVGGGG